MEIFFNFFSLATEFVVEWMYLILFVIFIATFLFLKESKSKLLGVFAIFGILFSFVSFWFLFIFSFRVSAEEFAIDGVCWNKGVNQSCIVEKPGVYLFSTKVIDLSNEKNRMRCHDTDSMGYHIKDACKYFQVSSKGFNLPSLESFDTNNGHAISNSVKIAQYF